MCCSPFGWCGNSSAHCAASTTKSTSATTSSGGVVTPSTTSNTNSGTITTSTITAATNTPSEFIVRQCVQPGMVALTYDDGPVPATNTLLNILSTLNVKATFFINGMNWQDTSAEPMRSIVKRMYTDGHQVAHHTWAHANLDTMDQAGVNSEMKRLDDLIKLIIGVRPLYMRPPYGAYSSATVDILKAAGYKYLVLWNAQSDDYDHSTDVALNMQSLSTGWAGSVNKYVGQSRGINSTASDPKRDSYIILNHDTYSATVDPWTATMVNYVRSLNFRFVTMTECMGDTASGAYRS